MAIVHTTKSETRHERATATPTQYFSLVGGSILLLVGLLSFIPAFLSSPLNAPSLRVENGYGYLLGLFAVNVFSNLVHLVFGLWGVLAYRGIRSARNFSQTMAIVFGVLALMGLVPVLSTTFGLMPLFGHNVWMHATLALVGAYFGFRTAEDRI
jgi:hypothetical protein